MLNPINHGNTPDAIARYKVEPYVMAADIYMAEPHTGRGGWTWYTGAAGWMYRLSIETLLGVQLEADQLSITPCVPAHWNSYKIHYRYRETMYHISMQRVAETSAHVIGVMVDGVKVSNASDDGAMQLHSRIPLVNDQQEHHVEVYF